MLRISQASPTKHAVMLKLEGRVVGPWVAELKRICVEQLAQNRVIELDFENVSFADWDGIALLVDLRSQGIMLRNCSLFLQEALRIAQL